MSMLSEMAPRCLAEFRYAECCYAECHYAECFYAECCYAECCSSNGRAHFIEGATEKVYTFLMQVSEYFKLGNQLLTLYFFQKQMF